MRRIPLPVFALAMTMAAAPLWSDPVPLPSNEALQALSGFDFVPTKPRLEQLFDGNVGLLVAVANDETLPETRSGVRLRAYHSLRNFTNDPTAAAGLRTAVDRYLTARSGTPLLFLMAALDSLGEIGDPSDVPTVLPLLDATDSRDLRAAAARALGGLHSQAACLPLDRHGDATHEPVEMVRIAANRAFHRLGC